MSLNTQNWKQFAFLYDIDTDTEQVLTFFQILSCQKLNRREKLLKPFILIFLHTLQVMYTV